MGAPKNTPAFPQSLNSEGPFGGMDLRDWFAGRAAAALASSHDNTGMWTGIIDKVSAEIIAERAYWLADAMLAEREKGGDA